MVGNVFRTVTCEFLVVCERINGFACFTQGFQRVYDELSEINQDAPLAHSIMESFVDLCYQESVITKQLRDSCPTRSETCVFPVNLP